MGSSIPCQQTYSAKILSAQSCARSQVQIPLIDSFSLCADTSLNCQATRIRAADSNSVGLRESGFRNVEQNLNAPFVNFHRIN
jgi:hypothetical protein